MFFLLELRSIICKWAEFRLVTDVFPPSEMTASSVSLWQKWDWETNLESVRLDFCRAMLGSELSCRLPWSQTSLPNTTTPYLPKKITVLNPLPFFISYNRILQHHLHRNWQVLMENNTICCLCGSKLCPMGDPILRWHLITYQISYWDVNFLKDIFSLCFPQAQGRYVHAFKENICVLTTSINRLGVQVCTTVVCFPENFALWRAHSSNGKLLYAGWSSKNFLVLQCHPI